MQKKVKLDNISIVLKQPRYPENIGATARVIRNMGMGKLVVVDPENCDLSKVRKMATHFASDIVEQKIFFQLQKKTL